MTERALPRQPRKAQPPSAQLDDLLTFDDAPPQAPRAVRPEPWMVRSAIHTFIASAVAYTGFHMVDLAPPYPLILAVCAGGVLVRRAVAATKEPSWQLTQDAVRPQAARRDPSRWYGDSDGMLDAVRRWDRRLDWGAGAPERFGATVALRLGELADERLRLRHGITRASDPARARRLVGDEVWDLLHRRRDQVPKPREVATAVARLETL